MSNQINVTRKEFSESFREHYLLYRYIVNSSISPKSRRLLLFYSVECGLKALIMKTYAINTYEGLKKHSEDYGKRVHGHDLKAMTKEVGIAEQFPLKKIHLSQGGRVLPDRYNELWRYGASVVDSREEEDEEKVLQRIAEWIGKRI